MTKQEKIMAGVDKIMWEAIGDDEGVIARNIMGYLHSQGVVLKVDCPTCGGDGRIQKFMDRTFSNRCPKCNGYGYVAVEPLVEEK